MGNWFREQWEQIRGELKWWAITKVGIYVAAGWAALMTTIVTTWGWVQNLPGPYLLLLGLGAFAVCLAIAVLCVFIANGLRQWWVFRQWERGKRPLPTNINQHHQVAPWLETVATEDSRDMAHRVHLVGGSENTVPHLNASEPYVDLIILLSNSSVYTLTLAKVEGKMTFRGSPLQATVEILNTRRELKHAEHYHLKLRQSLQPNTAQLILTSDRAEFAPGSVALWFTYQDQIGTQQSVRIAFGGTPFIVKDSSAKDAEITRLRDHLLEREDEITKLKSNVKECLGERGTSFPISPNTRQLQFEFSEALIDYSNQNLIVVRVRVRNPTESTIIGVSVRIASIVEIEKTGQANTAQSYIYHNLPLMLRDDRSRPPHDNIDLHPNDEAIFNLLTLQLHGTGTLLHHAIGDTDNTGWWSQRPSGALNPGRYRVQLKAQGRDIPAKTLSIEFENIASETWVHQVQEPSLLS